MDFARFVVGRRSRGHLCRHVWRRGGQSRRLPLGSHHRQPVSPLAPLADETVLFSTNNQPSFLSITPALAITASLLEILLDQAGQATAADQVNKAELQ
jgi:hypothetical protein